MKAEWKFKDAGRFWWRVEIWDTGDRRPDGEGFVDWVWGYSIFWENNSEPVYYGSVTGQLDKLPHLTEVLMDWQQFVTWAVVAGAQHSEFSILQS